MSDVFVSFEYKGNVLYIYTVNTPIFNVRIKTNRSVGAE